MGRNTLAKRKQRIVFRLGLLLLGGGVGKPSVLSCRSPLMGIGEGLSNDLSHRC